MPRIVDSIVILAPAETVWRVLADPTYIPRLYRDALTVEMNPPGPVAVGQRYKVLNRVGDLRTEVFVVITRVEKEKVLSSRGTPGGLFETFRHTVVLTPNAWETKVDITFEYTFSSSYTAKIPDVATAERTAGTNLRGYAQNLKDLSELLPLPS